MMETSTAQTQTEKWDFIAPFSLKIHPTSIRQQYPSQVSQRLLAKTVEPAPVDIVVDDHEQLPVAGGIRVIHVPGHSAGQVAYLWEEQGVLFAADAVANLFGKLRYVPVVEDFSLLQQSIQRLCGLTFETACFGHGEPLIGSASSLFRQRWA